MKGCGFFLIIFVFLGGCSNEPSNQNSIRLNLAEEPTSLDPRMGRDLYSMTLCRMLFDGLTRFSSNGNIELSIANEVLISEDGLCYTFSLKDTYWSDGSKLTSIDFMNSWKSILDPQFPTSLAHYLYPIKNAQSVKLGKCAMDQLGIQAPDLQTLIVTLEKPVPYFLELCSMSPFFPIPKNGIDPEKLISNGPFCLHSWRHLDEIIVKKNESYWDANHVALEKIHLLMVSPETEVRLFEENLLDWIGSPLSNISMDDISELKKSGKLSIHDLRGTCFFRLNTSELFRNRSNPLRQQGFRQALYECLDRQALTEFVLQGGQIPAFSFVPPSMGLNTIRNHFQIKNDFGREPLVISLIANERNLKLAQVIQYQWKTALGVDVELEVLEAKVYYQKIYDKDYQIALSSWIADFDDPINFLEIFKYKDNGLNQTFWENAKYIELLNRSEICTDLENRRQLLQDAEKILMDEMPIIPIYHYVMNYAQNKDLQNVSISPIGQLDFRSAVISKR